MTEDEAKTKWCPMVSDKKYVARCIGSNCMMWRWTNQQTVADIRAEANAREISPAEIKAKGMTEGRCGLAQ